MSKLPLAYEYNPALDIITIEGVRYTGEFFRTIRNGTKPRIHLSIGVNKEGIRMFYKHHCNSLWRRIFGLGSIDK